MPPYFKSWEFWQCSVFLVWSSSELVIVGLRVASFTPRGPLLVGALLITGAFSLVKAFASVVQWRLRNPDSTKSPVARVFLYSTGTLALTLQTVWYLIPPR